MMQTNLEWNIITGFMPYQEAVEEVEALGDNWRMPTIQELISLIDFTKIDPANDSSPALESMPYWTVSAAVQLFSSERSSADDEHWVVNFDRGNLGTAKIQSGHGCLIAVRECGGKS